MRVLLLFLLMLAATQPLIADVVIPIESVEFHVNVRFGADPKTEIVGHLQRGSSMPLVRSIPGWHEVSLEGGGTGFISEDWCRVVSEEQAAEARQQPTAIEDTRIDDTRDDNGDSANVGDQLKDTAPITSAVAEVAADAVTSNDAALSQAVESGAVTAVLLAAANVDADATAASPEAIAADGPTSVLAQIDDQRPDAPTDQLPEEPAEALEAEDELLRAAALEQQSQFATIDAATGQPFLLQGPPGPRGPEGPPGADGIGTIEGTVDHLMKFTAPNIGGNSQVFDNGNSIGIGTTEPKQRLEVNGNIQIHERNSSVAGLILTQSSGESGYIMHNRASTLTIGAGSVDRITIDRDGNVGIGINEPDHPIEMSSGAYVSAGGVWTNSSSIEKKENVRELTPEEALTALVDLQAVRFNYKQDRGEEYLGFIAEDVPELVATADRKGLSAMDVVAVLTAVVQAQQQQIDELESRLNESR